MRAAGLHSQTLWHIEKAPPLHWEGGVLNILRPLLKPLKLIGGQTPAFICLSIPDSLDYMTVSYDQDATKQGGTM